MYSKSLMFRALAPYLLIASLITLGCGIAYASGGPAWLALAASLLSSLVVAPAYGRWLEQNDPPK